MYIYIYIYIYVYISIYVFPVTICTTSHSKHCLLIGDALRVLDVSLKQRYTEPPLHLSESELLALMDRHGIGHWVENPPGKFGGNATSLLVAGLVAMNFISQKYWEFRIIPIDELIFFRGVQTTNQNKYYDVLLSGTVWYHRRIFNLLIIW